MSKQKIAFRIDVDTYRGMVNGVPRLLESFAKHDVTGTFFVVMGPDTMGQHIKRFKHKNYFKRILRINPFKLMKNYGLASFLYGTILPGKKIGEGNPDILRDIQRLGHEVGIHSYNHAEWADHYLEMTAEQFHNQFQTAISICQEILGAKPQASAAPNWRCTETSLAVQDQLSFLYASDMRGQFPFLPCVNGTQFTTLQIPQNLPASHEVLQQKRVARNEVIQTILNQATEHYNIITIHDWFEGMSESWIVDEAIQRIQDRGMQIVRMFDMAQEILTDRASIPVCAYQQRPIPGGIDNVTCQVVPYDKSE